MDKLVYWGLENQQDKKCANCGMEKSISEKGCCKDDQQQLKGEDDQKITSASFNLTPLSSFAYLIHFFEYKLAVPVKAIRRLDLTESPPAKPGLAVYLRNCVFLI